MEAPGCGRAATSLCATAVMSGGDAIPSSGELDVLCVGEALWDLAPPRGRTLALAPSLRFRPGGAAVNAALLLARLGWKAGLAAVVGDDALGEALTARIAARGVSTALVQRAPPRTGLCFVEHGTRAARVVGYRSAGEAAPDLAAAFRARALLLTGVTPSPEQASSFGAAAREARRHGARVMVDLNARPLLWRGRSATPAWLVEADVIKASEPDLAAMGIDEAALRALMRASAVLVVTAGPRPARAIGSFGEVRRAPASRAHGSAMGAGDAFAAGLLDAMLRAGDASLEDDGAFWSRALSRGHALARRTLAR
jgi:2-dehydro-3-deoxygluconokinase